MVAVWAVFTLIVFVFEPLVVHRLFHDYALRDKDRAFSLAIRLHAAALTISCVAIVAGVLGRTRRPAVRSRKHRPRV